MAPSYVRAKVESSTAITVQWSGLTPCREVNGLIVGYRVQYCADSSGDVQFINQDGRWNVVRVQISLTGLTPFTNYYIQVAAVNSKGDIGLYSDPLSQQTHEDSESV